MGHSQPDDVGRAALDVENVTVRLWEDVPVELRVRRIDLERLRGAEGPDGEKWVATMLTGGACQAAVQIVEDRYHQCRIVPSGSNTVCHMHGGHKSKIGDLRRRMRRVVAAVRGRGMRGTWP